MVKKSRKVRKELLICAEITRCSQQDRDKTKRTKRYYSMIDNAFAFSVRWMMRDGRVKDTIAIYHIVTGLEIGTISMNSLGRISIKGLIKELT